METKAGKSKSKRQGKRGGHGGVGLHSPREAGRERVGVYHAWHEGRKETERKGRR